MDAFYIPPSNTRIGLHYFPDTHHYRESDVKTWVPRLKALGANWLVVQAPPARAIPETFLAGLVQAGIEPILQFNLPLAFPARTDSLELLLPAYAGWGVHYVVFYDRPNLRSAWPANAWTQVDLVERFLDLYLPLAEAALQAGLIPVFPPLEPGGDYWDTAFLRAALQGLQRRGCEQLLNTLVLGAYARLDAQPLNWGAGGPERWPGARPYFTPSGQQDQRGFYIFDWYLAITQAALGMTRPLLLLGAGSRLRFGADPNEREAYLEDHAHQNLNLARLMVEGRAYKPDTVRPGPQAPGVAAELDPVAPEVLACNFWLMAAESGDDAADQAWFQPENEDLPVTAALAGWIRHQQAAPDCLPGRVPLAKGSDPAGLAARSSGSPAIKSQLAPGGHPIAHYLLLPTYEWGIADWHLEAIRPFIKKHRPAVGFSLDEAACAARVTVIGGPQSFSEEAIEKLVQAGCYVERIAGDGTSIATQLATR
jgi:hypothetical protein